MPTCVPSNVSGEFNASAYTIGKSGSYNVAVDLHWTCDDVGNNIVSGYRICFRDEGTAAESAQTKDVAGVGTRQCTVDQLQGHAAYVFTVAACNAAGAGPPSREMVLKTAEQNDHAMFQLRKVTSPSKDAPAATTAPAVTTTGTAQCAAPLLRCWRWWAQQGHRCLREGDESEWYWLLSAFWCMQRPLAVGNHGDACPWCRQGRMPRRRKRRRKAAG